MTRVYLDLLWNHSGVLRFFALCLLKHHSHYTSQSTKVNFLANPGKDNPESVTRWLNLGQEFSSLSFSFYRGQDFLELIFPQIMEVFNSAQKCGLFLFHILFSSFSLCILSTYFSFSSNLSIRYKSKKYYEAHPMKPALPKYQQLDKDTVRTTKLETNLTYN